MAKVETREEAIIRELGVLEDNINKLFDEEDIDIKEIRRLIEETGALKGELNRERGIEQ